MDTPFDEAGIRDQLSADLGASLRAILVGDLSTGDYALSYIRDDIEDLYTPEEIQQIVNDDLVRHFLEMGTGPSDKLGTLRYEVRGFDDALFLLAWSHDFALGITFERDEHAIPVVIETLEEYRIWG
ncbi:MAG: hypothetical protein U5K37_06220 [Natrialbaceae archaeon]|nr:hypothetical protein [Natrialbaceae archaeon]